MDHIMERQRALAKHLSVSPEELSLHYEDEFYLHARQHRPGDGPSGAIARVELVRKALRITRGSETDAWTTDFLAGEYLRHLHLKAELEEKERRLAEVERAVSQQGFATGRSTELYAAAEKLHREHGRLVRLSNTPVTQWTGPITEVATTKEQLKKFERIAWKGALSFSELHFNAQRPYFVMARIASDPTVQRLRAECAALGERMRGLATYHNLEREFRANPQTEPMTHMGIHDLVNTLYFLTPDSDRPDEYERTKAWRLALHRAFDGKPVEEWRELESTQDSIWLVLTPAEAEVRRDQALENLLDEVVLPEIPEGTRKYFDKEKWMAEARADAGKDRDGKAWNSRGLNLAGYDFQEHEVRDPESGMQFYAYRTN